MAVDPVCLCLAFDKRSGFLKDREALAAVPKEKLIPALKILLRGEEGQSVTALAQPLANLTYEELQPLWPEIVYRVEHRLSENVMFANMQTACFEILAEHRVEEGLQLVGPKMFTQNGWGGGRREDGTLKALKKYGTHAKRAFFPLQMYLQRNVAFNPKLQAFKREITSTTETPELRSIQLYLGDYEIGAHLEQIITMRELRKQIAMENLAEYWKVYERCQELLAVKPETAESTNTVLDELMAIPEAAEIVEAHLAIEEIIKAFLAEKITREQAAEQLDVYRKKYDIADRGPNLVYWYSLMWRDNLRAGKTPKLRR